MPRSSKAKAEQNREAIETMSSMLMRKRGLNISVADIMSAVGLTHGGFYKHFDSKEQLASIACSKAFAESIQRWEKRTQAKSKSQAHEALIKGYLSKDNLTVHDHGCPMAALAVDVAREPQSSPIRAAFHEGVTELINIMASFQPGDNPIENRKQSLLELSTLVGTMVLARATLGTDLSHALIMATEQDLLDREK